MGRLPTTLQMVFRLANSGKQSTKVHAFTNPAFEASSPAGNESTAITMQAADDLVESMFPGSGRSLLRRMAIQFCAVVLLVVAHGFVIAYTDPIYTSAPLTQVIVYSVQVGLLLAILMAFFVLTSQTLYISLGRYDLYLKEFAPLYGLFLVELALYVALKVYATVLLYRRMSHLALWDAPGYTPLWAVQRVVLLLFWVAAVASSVAVFDVRYFDPEHLVERVQEGRSARSSARARRGRR